MGGRFPILLAVVAITCLVPEQGVAEEGRLDQIEKRVKQLEQRTKQDIGPGMYVLPGLSLVAIAVYCALWARSTGRDPWLWLSAGLVFNFFTLFAIWIKHDHDQEKKTQAEQAGLWGKLGVSIARDGPADSQQSPPRPTSQQVQSSDQIRK